MKGFHFLVLLFCSGTLLSILLLATCTPVDTITPDQTIRDGHTIISSGESFEMGFFSPDTSTSKRFFGIWYKKLATGTVVWVANREVPITNTLGFLTLSSDGILGIQNDNNRIIWSSNSSGTVQNPVAQLLDSGNLVIRDTNDNNPDNFIWQSFDFPIDTLLPGQKFGNDLVKGINRHFVAWKSAHDPSPGNVSASLDTVAFPQMLMRRGSKILYREGPWISPFYSGEHGLGSNPLYTYEFVQNDKEIYYQFHQPNSSVLMRLFLNFTGERQRLLWSESSHQWIVYWTAPADRCDQYGLCGVHASCTINNPPCGCLEGFEPRFPEQWNLNNWTQGCRRVTPLNCGSGEGFRKYANKKFPDTRHSWYNLTLSLEECRKLCKNNCSCTAYANTDVSGSGSGCILWFGDLLDIRDFVNNGQDIYIRIAASELITVSTKGKEPKILKQVKIVIPVIAATVILLGSFLLYIFRRRKLQREDLLLSITTASGIGPMNQTALWNSVISPYAFPGMYPGNLDGGVRQYHNRSQNEDPVLPLFNMATLLKATNNFSINNKIGEGGFGPVYKGKLLTGQDIAVKRLSINSRQGTREFKNEILLISKLQHRNLVKILGCCLEGEERMIAYEYMPNNSLDSFLFDKEKRVTLTWQHRIDIAIGIAKGLLYLHHDSRLRIIHRDLKASNILLDEDLNPKISDFGTARIFGGDQGEGRTKHVIGTYGYMSPEYVIHGKFSVKSDVFSFGVLLLEIVSGKKNTKFDHPDHNHGLLGHAWLLWKEGNALELLDANLKDSCVESQVLRCIEVSLLCIQKFPKDRPTMSSVVFMLSNEGAILAKPKEPGFYTDNSSTDADITCSEVTTTMPEGR